MARGYSQSRSEGPGYSEGSDRKSQPRSEYPPETEDYKYKNELKADFMALARTKDGEEGKAMSNMDDKVMADIIKHVADETSEARSQREDFDHTVKLANRAIENDTVDWGSYSESGDILPLTLGEVLNGDEGFDIINDAVEEDRPDDIADFVRDFIKDRVMGANTLREDYDSEVQVAREDAIKSFIEERNKRS
jgi:hypothetical protein